MSSVTIEIPENIANLAKDLPIEKVTREALVLELYRRATISSGKARNSSAWAESSSSRPPGIWAFRLSA
jgi:hypothetical protein